MRGFSTYSKCPITFLVNFIISPRNGNGILSNFVFVFEEVSHTELTEHFKKHFKLI